MDNFTRVTFDKKINVKNIIGIREDFSFADADRNFWEMVYVEKGEMLCRENENEFILKSGEIAFKKADEVYTFSNNSGKAIIIAFRCQSRAIKRLYGGIFRLQSADKALLSALFEEGFACFDGENAPFGCSQMVKNLLEILLIRLCRSEEIALKKSRQSLIVDGEAVPYNIKEILEFLNANIYGKITISDIAEATKKSESTVKQLFYKYKKDGIMKYYNRLKIDEACRLISEGKYSITQISKRLCFDNPQYFSKCFKSFTGMTPSEYKHSHDKEIL